MKAQDNVTYAILNANNVIVEIFTKDIYKEWDERSIKTIALSPAQVSQAKVGAVVNSDGSIGSNNIESLREQVLEMIAFCYEQEIEAIKGNVSENEVLTYQTQVSEANAFLSSGNANDAPFLQILSDQRGIDLATLAQKIIDKNTIYNTRLAKVLGYYQSLKDSVEAMGSIAELEKVTYKSPLSDEI